jgi:hypothetical protein
MEILLLTLLLAYFIPSFVAYHRNNPSKAGILILNIFLGWTFLGWVVSLAWAFAGETRHVTVVPSRPKLIACRIVAACIVLLVLLGIGMSRQDKASGFRDDTATDVSVATTSLSGFRDKTKEETVEVRRAIPVEVRRAIPVSNTKE